MKGLFLHMDGHVETCGEEATPITYFMMVDEDVRKADLAGEVLLESNGPDEEGMLVLYSTKYFKAQVDRNLAWDEMVRDAAPYAPKFCGPLLILTTCEGHIPERCAELAARKWSKPVEKTELPDAFKGVTLIKG